MLKVVEPLPPLLCGSNSDRVAAPKSIAALPLSVAQVVVGSGRPAGRSARPAAARASPTTAPSRRTAASTNNHPMDAILGRAPSCECCCECRKIDARLLCPAPSCLLEDCGNRVAPAGLTATGLLHPSRRERQRQCVNLPPFRIEPRIRRPRPQDCCLPSGGGRVGCSEGRLLPPPTLPSSRLTTHSTTCSIHQRGGHAGVARGCQPAHIRTSWCAWGT